MPEQEAEELLIQILLLGMKDRIQRLNDGVVVIAAVYSPVWQAAGVWELMSLPFIPTPHKPSTND